MSWFTKEQKIKPIPRTEGSLYGEKLLTDIAGRTPNVPLREIAGLTPVQRIIQGMLGDTLGRVTEGSTEAHDYYKDILGSEYDLESDPRYKTLMQQSDILTRKASTQARRGSERRGMLDSSAADVFEGSEIQKAQSPILQAIGDLLTRKEGERMGAAEGIGRAGAQELRNIAAVGGMADLGRSIEQMQADALYNQVLMQMMFPYQYQANLAGSLMNYRPDYAVTGGGLSDLGFYFQTMSSATGATAGAMGGGAGGG